MDDRTCTCLGSCKGAEGLAPGWVCALRRAPRPDSLWPTIEARLLATPGDVVLGLIAQLWPMRRAPIARDMLRMWVRVHRAQEVAHG